MQDSLGSWLHDVAYRVASRARSDVARRRQHELRLAEVRGPAWEVMPDRHQFDTGAILSEEAVLVAARPSVAALPLRLGLVQATTQAMTCFKAGKVLSSGVISRSVVSLSQRTCKTIMLNKLWAATASLALRVIATGAIVSAQPTDERREQTAPASTIPRSPQAVAGGGGNVIIDWIPADGKGGKKEIIIDPTRHCIHMSMTSFKRDDRLNDCIVRIDLERGKKYTVTAAGEAFMSEQTGVDTDRSPGVVLLYSTDENESKPRGDSQKDRTSPAAHSTSIQRDV